MLAASHQIHSDKSSVRWIWRYIIETDHDHVVSYPFQKTVYVLLISLDAKKAMLLVQRRWITQPLPVELVSVSNMTPVHEQCHTYVEILLSLFRAAEKRPTATRRVSKVIYLMRDDGLPRTHICFPKRNEVLNGMKEICCCGDVAGLQHKGER
jgi:hypothetical protein